MTNSPDMSRKPIHPAVFWVAAIYFCIGLWVLILLAIVQGIEIYHG